MLAKKKSALKKKNKAKKKKTTKKKSGTKRNGLYANIHKARERAARGGRPVRKKGEAGAPSDQDFENASKTAE